ncbi:stellacyanin-like [Typha angustifolia]|uniref:stellacyanin-like n=1 Tax=Typha angustifolia TaxID=59011 RepID=UPI003C2C7AE3
MGNMAKALIAALAMAAIFQLAVGTNYTVGAPAGSWDLQTNFTNWASSISFLTGDFLIFKYSSSQHDVLEVTMSNYGSCTTSNPISTDASGNTVVALTAPGTRYFICGIPGHCAGGMKVQIDVSAKSAPATPPTSGSSPPPPPPPPSPTTTPPSQTNSPPSGVSPALAPPPQGSAAGVSGLGVQEKVAFAFGLGVLMLVAF